MLSPLLKVTLLSSGETAAAGAWIQRTYSILGGV